MLILSISCQSQKLQIYVSPNGNDQNNGTLDTPLQSLDSALKLAKAEKQENAGKAITIFLRAGTHYLQETARLNSHHSGTKESPFQIKAYPDEKVVISGAKKLDMVWENAEDGILRGTLKEAISFDQLFINGQKQIRARYPNYNPDILVYNGYAADAISPERIKTWSKPETGVLHAMHRAEWGGYHYVITGVDDNGEAILDGGFQNNRQMGMHKDYRFIENIKEELDAPGEWFFDREDKVLYYYPEEGFDPGNALVEVPVLDHLMELNGTEQDPVHHVEIDGFIFRHTRTTYMQTKEPLLRSDWTIYRGGVILLEGTEDISISNNHFMGVGGNGVFVSNYNRGTNISTNHFEEIGASAIAFVGQFQSRAFTKF